MSDTPNVVVIMTDQQRADLSHREGFALDTTPFTDSLARGGVWFDRAYTTMPVCAPARVSMLSGRYPSATRVRTNWNIEDAFYSQDMFDVFRAQGYKTALIGKNHSHLTPDRTDGWFHCGHLGIDGDDLTDEERAFNGWMEGTHFHMADEPTPFPLECQIPYRLVSKAKEWIGSLEEEPFLLWLSFPEPHNPYQVPEPYYSLFPPETLPPLNVGEEALDLKGFKYRWCRESFESAFRDYPHQIDRARSNYLGMLRLLDDQIRRFVAFLDEKGLTENTILVILSDHGDFFGEYGLLRKGPELPEPLIRIPMLFSGPGIRCSEGPSEAFVSIADVMPTICEAIGAPIPEGVQGRSLWPILTGADYPEEEFSSIYAEQGFGGLHYMGDEELDPAKDGLTRATEERDGAFDCLNSWTQSGALRMVRKGSWKLIFDMQGSGQLYDLERDPAELKNLYDDPKHIAKRVEMLEEMLKWRLRTEDPLPLPRNRYVMKKDPRNYWGS